MYLSQFNNEMTTYVIADIHGNFLGLQDVLKQCKFKRNSDNLINLGDVCDGGNRTKDVIDKLLTIKHHILCASNHDTWALKWMKTGDEPAIWWNQGGQRTAESYNFDYESVPQAHIDFLENAVSYYIDTKNRIFVHGGFNPDTPIETQDIEFLTWDRTLLCDYAPNHIIKNYAHVFVGHTSTQFFNTLEPVTFHNLTCVDTGAGWNGRLTIMNVDGISQFWQSKISANMQNKLSMYQQLSKLTF